MFLQSMNQGGRAPRGARELKRVFDETGAHIFGRAPRGARELKLLD